MGQKEKRKGGSILSFFVIVIIALLQIAGEWGAFFLGVLIVLGLVGSLIWGIKKASGERPGYGHDARDGGSARPLSDRYGQGGRTARPRTRSIDTPPYRPGSPTTADAQLREDNRRRMEELKDLLEAGIIDRAEYLDRMADLEA